MKQVQSIVSVCSPVKIVKKPHRQVQRVERWLMRAYNSHLGEGWRIDEQYQQVSIFAHGPEGMCI